MDYKTSISIDGKNDKGRLAMNVVIQEYDTDGSLTDNLKQIFVDGKALLRKAQKIKKDGVFSKYINPCD